MWLFNMSINVFMILTLTIKNSCTNYILWLIYLLIKNYISHENVILTNKIMISKISVQVVK